MGRDSAKSWGFLIALNRSGRPHSTPQKNKPKNTKDKIPMYNFH